MHITPYRDVACITSFGGVCEPPGLGVSTPNHAFQGSAGQRGWPVPSSLRSSAPPERER